MSVADIFFDAQKSSINHKSLTKRLRKIEAKYQNSRSRFEDQFKQSLLRCLEVTKSEKAGLNIVKFLCSYCAVEQSQEREDEDETNSITSQVLILMLPHMSAKDRIVRYRATQIVSQLMGIVQEIEDELYQAIRHELGKRIRDKVPAIRLEAVCALGRLLENEMDEEAQATHLRNDEDDEMLDDDDELESTGLLDKLLDVLQNDTNADVRKALLLNLPIEPKTLPYLLERARDKDASVRRSLYAKLTPKLGDFRHLSTSMREKLLRWGLRDRDERVRKAAAQMFSTRWIEQIAKTISQVDAEMEEGQPRKKQIGFYEPDMKALLELLERVDIMNSGQEDGVALEAMNAFWSMRPDYFQEVTFSDEFFANLSTESAFLARSFYHYCAKTAEAHLKASEEDKLPEVTRLGFHLQNRLNNVLHLREVADDDDPETIEKLNEQEFMTEQLLHIAHTLDYTDEIGRRKMSTVLRNTIAFSDLPDEITKLAIEALRLTCTSDVAGEKDFIAFVQEAIVEIQDDPANQDEQVDNGTNRETSPDDNDSFVSAQSELSQRSDATEKPQATILSKRQQNMTPEELEADRLQTLLVQLKCLSIAHTLLQNITSDFSTNVSLETLLNTLVIPAVRSTDAPIREKGTECLGLACLLSAKLYNDNRDLFIYCLSKGHEELKIMCLRILCDCLMTHGNTDEQVDLSPFTKAYGYSAEVQLCATTCIAKLMMCGFYKPTTPDTAPIEGQDDAEEESTEADVFEAAIEEATQAGTKGCDLLGKVKAALVADHAAVEKGRTQAGMEVERRQS